MNNDSKLIFENYVDGVTQRKNELAGNIMDIVRYGIPSKEEFIKIRQELHDLVDMVNKRGDKANDEENSLAKELIGKIRAYRSQHPDDPPGLYPQKKQEDAEEDIDDSEEAYNKGEEEHYKNKEEDAEESSFSAKLKDRENEQDEKQRDAEVSSAFHYDPMSGLEKAANQIRDILQGAANDEARTEHIIKMAQTILGSPKDYNPNEYRKMLDGLIVLLNRFIVVPMN